MRVQALVNNSKLKPHQINNALQAMLEAKVDRVFMPHGLGHFLGLDVHDVSDVGPVPVKLQADHVITCEPGIYFIDLLLDRAAAKPDQKQYLNLQRIEAFKGAGGVRIEDNVVLTEQGNVNLTAPFAPKTVADIESTMAAA